ncbi:MAG: hypothetical protein VYA69_07775 [Gemmatimonadota bacterium]|nr:hypothetical protein [Gemmatimonadota bacterium]
MHISTVTSFMPQRHLTVQNDPSERQQNHGLEDSRQTIEQK